MSNLGEYLKSLNNLYSKSNNQSIGDILNSFSQLSQDYSENVENSFTYTSYKYNECPLAEKQHFFEDQLQFIECLVIKTIYEKSGMIWNWFDIYNLMGDDSYRNIEKTMRKVVYSTSGTSRPIGELSYAYWNGLQIIDIDIKNEELAEKLKYILFDELKNYYWFLGCCKSASKKSLHIWTKITPISIKPKNKKIEYLCNFRHKYSYIYIVLLKYAAKLEYTKEDIFKFLDMAMAKPQQGIFISSDDKAILNTNFRDTRLDVNFENAFHSGVSSINWISHPDLKDIFHKLDWFAEDTNSQNINLEVSNISNINDRDKNKSKGSQHYKHAQRWQLANTLTSIYGKDKALEIMLEICKNTPKSELLGDVKTASIHNKPISIWAVKELNSVHGFNIQIKTDNKLNIPETDKENKQVGDVNDNLDPIKILNDNSDRVILKISNNQYLSDIKGKILNNLGKITLLEAGAGYGKTEMIKSLRAKTLLILPFTSTIKAKVEADQKTSDWLYYYGSKRPTLEEILGDKNMSMTIDKFSRLNVYELDQAGFEYIVIDESHLLFTSSYRSVMSPTIQRIANCKAKIIMMTGTPTGELLFFPNIKHIKVIKEDFRQKEFEIHTCPTKKEKIIEMCKCMANDIANGHKILFPTNNGNLYYEQITSIIQEILIEKYKEKFTRKLNSFYYKKSNFGEESMDMINIDKSIGNNDIIFCTNYLSVGVDICDKYRFSVYFNELWIPQDIEQFANRLRNNDLYIKLFLELEDDSGMPINYYYKRPLDLSFSESDLLLARDLLFTANDMINRNQEESKYNPLILSLLSSNNYLKYDENDCQYYIDETTYKLNIFEQRYSDYSKQLLVLIDSMKYYGYMISNVQHKDRISDETQIWLEEYLKEIKKNKYNKDLIETFIFLDHINDNNIEYYKNLIKGSYEIFKSSKYELDRKENNIYAANIEILEKNLPIVNSLYKFYDCATIKEIFEYCVEKKQNRINYTKLNRIRSFVNIEYNRRRKKVDFPVLKFIQDAHKFAKENKIISKELLTKWQAAYAAKYADSIKDIVIDDINYLEEIFDLIKQLWSIVIIQSRPKNGNVVIQPFELLWKTKYELEDIYGNMDTKTFFLQDLLDEMKNDDNNELIEEELPELEKTRKLKLSDVKDDLPNVVHDKFNYDEYTELDGSNDRFMKKQENTKSENMYPKAQNDVNENISDNIFYRDIFEE